MNKEQLLTEFKTEIEQICKTDEGFDAWKYIVEFCKTHGLQSSEVKHLIPENCLAWYVIPGFTEAIRAKEGDRIL